jgi:hypothetical protein
MTKKYWRSRKEGIFPNQSLDALMARENLGVSCVEGQSYVVRHV